VIRWGRAGQRPWASCHTVAGAIKPQAWGLDLEPSLPLFLRKNRITARFDPGQKAPPATAQVAKCPICEETGARTRIIDGRGGCQGCGHPLDSYSYPLSCKPGLPGTKARRVHFFMPCLGAPLGPRPAFLPDPASSGTLGVL
jgi:hypothetical protein